MPNYCSNKLTITATTPENKAQLKQFITHMRTDKDVTVFGFFDPCPEVLRNTESRSPETEQQLANKEKYGYTDWYPWCIDRWGTKWEALDPDLCDSSTEDRVHLTFDTAWCPAEALYKTLIKQGFRIYATYFEAGCDFHGRYTTHNGELLEDDAGSIVDALADYYGDEYKAALKKAEEDNEYDDLMDLEEHYQTEFLCA